jgi:hypothetical protein
MKYQLQMITLALLIIIMGCKAQSRKITYNYYEFTLYNTFKDTCMVLKGPKGDTISYYRNVEILENTFSDSLVFALGVIPPGRLGKAIITQIDTFIDGGMYASKKYINDLISKDDPDAKTKFLCIRHYLVNKPYIPAKKEEFMRIRVKVSKK